ncbi:ABC transporter permease [Fusibacter ferrireducens]|uniref:ABC transporter permease n=1 Tax=Fusibacter ferrireducens TaxID=2785058 RepID=A0ABR9ZSQ3_9FIRM|nr:ABC transporter permease [Fusibacter ferrireducens]MBF4692910.1 ABC transporter permease [Fusibacter ferrireducens]
MSFITEGFKEALALLLSFDREVYTIIGLSVGLSLTSTLLAAIMGIPFGLYFGLKTFRLKKVLTRLLYTAMSLPPVVVGLLVAILFSRKGPLGSFGLMFTPTAMIIAQVILVTPIIMGIIFNASKEKGRSIYNMGKTLGASRFQVLLLMIAEMRVTILIAIVTGFGRAVSEVGAVMIVGGNIKGHTRVMTTFIAMNNSMGNYGMAIAMGLVLLTISFIVNSILYHFTVGD